MSSTYIAQPLSRKTIRSITQSIRKAFGFEDLMYFPIVEMLETMPTLFAENGFHFEIVPDAELPDSVQGDTDVNNHYMRVKESVYDGACAGNGRDRYSIAHEIGHYMLLSVAGVSFQRNIANKQVRAYEDPEWQAECFAGELLMPFLRIQTMAIENIVTSCGVSATAARTQHRIVSK